MNTLDDLRRTLDHHAHDVHDDVVHSRTAAVRGRAVAVRRRRAAGVATAAALAVVGVVSLPPLVGGPVVDPAGGAPDTRTALGWTYRFDDMVHTDDDVLEVKLDDSDLPRLVSWSTDGVDQAVEVRAGWPGRSLSRQGDHDDYLQLPPGYAGTVTISGPEGLSLATYTLDTSASPEGVGSGPRTFREDVAGYDLLGAVAGEAGEAAVEVDLVPEASTTWISYYCEGLPRGYRMHANWVGASGSVIFGGCDDTSSFDPGGSPGLGISAGQRAGTPQTLRMWVTRDGAPVADGEVPGLRLGLGAYVANGSPQTVEGVQMREQIESAGHVWQLVDVVREGAGREPQVETPAEGQFLVRDAVSGRGMLAVAIAVDGVRTNGATRMIGTGGGGGGEELVPAGSTVSLEFGRTIRNVDGSGIALYERID